MYFIKRAIMIWMIRFLLEYFFLYLQSYSSKTLSLTIIMWNEILYLVEKIKLSWTERYHISWISLYPNYVLGMTTPRGLIERYQTGLKLYVVQETLRFEPCLPYNAIIRIWTYYAPWSLGQYCCVCPPFWNMESTGRDVLFFFSG